MMDMMEGGFFGLGWLISAIIVIAIVGMLLTLIPKASSKPPERKSEEPDNHDLLKRRLANGEISEEEYERLKRKMDE